MRDVGGDANAAAGIVSKEVKDLEKWIADDDSGAERFNASDEEVVPPIPAPLGLDANVTRSLLALNAVAERLLLTTYLQRVAVEDVRVGPGIRAVTGKEVLGVFGRVRNTGDRSLTEVDVMIHGTNSRGERIFEKTYHAVLPGLNDKSSPLKPGLTCEFGMNMDDAPNEWNGEVGVEVTRVEFS